MPFGAVATIPASPAATPVARPLAFTPATAGSVTLQVNTTPAIGAFPASRAVAVNVCVAPVTIVAEAGATVTGTTVGGGGGASLSLQAPKVFATGLVQVPSPCRWREVPTGSVPASITPMSADKRPTAGPLVAVKVPSYERNSTTAPPPFTSATPSGLPF